MNDPTDEQIGKLITAAMSEEGGNLDDWVIIERNEEGILAQISFSAVSREASDVFSELSEIYTDTSANDNDNSEIFFAEGKLEEYPDLWFAVSGCRGWGSYSDDEADGWMTGQIAISPNAESEFRSRLEHDYNLQIVCEANEMLEKASRLLKAATPSSRSQCNRGKIADIMMSLLAA